MSRGKIFTRREIKKVHLLPAIAGVSAYLLGQFLAPLLIAIAGVDKNLLFPLMLISYSVIIILIVIFCKRAGIEIYEKFVFSLKYIFIIIFLYAAIIGISFLLVNIFGESTTQNSIALEGLMELNKYVFIIFTVIYAPIAEEFIFRGLILKHIFANYSILGLIVSSLLFCFMHGPTDLFSFLNYFSAGLMLGLSCLLTKKSVGYSTVLHILNNAIPVLIMFRGSSAA